MTSQETLAYIALDAAKALGARYADVRVIDTKTQCIETKNLEVSNPYEEETTELAVRVLYRNGWGFGAAITLSKAGIIKAAQQAIESAKISDRCQAMGVDLFPGYNRKRRDGVELAPVEAYTAEWISPYKKDPFQVPIETKVAILLNAARIMRKVKGIDLTTGQMTFTKSRKLFVSTVGSNIVQTFITSSCGIDASAFDADGRYQTRSYPSSFGGQYENAGWEMVEKWDLVGHAQQTAEEAMALCSAPVCPEGVKTLILGSDQVGLQIHESCGHATEADRVFGTEVNYAGNSFLTPNLLGKLKYGSDIVNLTANATHAGGLGGFGFDDEGVPAQRVPLIEHGRFVGYMTSRQTAARLGLEHSGGCMRADGANTPLIRMTNVSLEPGNAGTLDDILADTEDGSIYMATCKSWSIGSDRRQFQFGTEIAWEVKGGKLGKIYRDPSYSGITPRFWGSCDAIASESIIWGVPTCAKGQPCQAIGTGHGSPVARFRRVKVGGAIPTTHTCAD